MMKRMSLLSLALAIGLVGCSAPSLTQTRMFVSGTPSIKGVVSDQARMMISVTRMTAPPVMGIPATSFDTVDFTLSNATLLTQDATASKSMSGSGTTSQVFTALRPGAGYSLDLELKTGTTHKGMSHVSPITLTAGETNRVAVVVGIDNKINVTQSTSKNRTGAAGSWVIVKGDTVTLDTGFGTLSGTQITAAKVQKLRVKLSSELYGGSAIVLDEVTTTAVATYTWNTKTATTTFTPATLTTDAVGTITFEILDDTGAIVGRSELRNVTIAQGQGVDIELIEGSPAI